MIDFFVACVPPKSTGNDKRIMKFGNKVIVSKKPKSLEAENTWQGLLLDHQPDEVVAGPVSLTIELTWPWRKSEKKSVVKTGRAHHTTKPDLDNLSKTICDQLVTLRFIADDAQVAELTMRKFWGDKPGVRIVIRTIGTEVMTLSEGGLFGP